MKKLMQILSILSVTTILSGCPIIITHEAHDCPVMESKESNNGSCAEMVTNEPKAIVAVESKTFSPSVNYQTIGEYTEQMVAVLLDKSAGHNFERPIAVPPFMYLVSEETYSQKLAVEIPENIIADLRSENLLVSEYRLTPPLPEDNIPYEDIIESIEESQKFGYVLKGTIRSNPHGVTVFVKIIQLDTQAVVASASKHLPQYILLHHS